MTEAEWLASTDPAEMLRWLTRDPYADVGEIPPYTASDRKLRLFACACFACIAPILDEWEDEAPDGESFIASFPGWPRGGSWGWACHWARDLGGKPPMPTRAALLREIFGNSWRPERIAGLETVGKSRKGTTSGRGEAKGHGNEPAEHRISPAILSWNSRAIPRLAQAIYDGRDFGAMPLLADELEQAGAPKELSEHCRGTETRPCPAGCQAIHGRTGTWVYALAGPSSEWVPCRSCDRTGRIKVCGPHVRGCHVLDMLTGKE